jgi:hypothetical protein
MFLQEYGQEKAQDRAGDDQQRRFVPGSFNIHTLDLTLIDDRIPPRELHPLLHHARRGQQTDLDGGIWLKAYKQSVTTQDRVKREDSISRSEL